MKFELTKDVWFEGFDEFPDWETLVLLRNDLIGEYNHTLIYQGKTSDIPEVLTNKIFSSEYCIIYKNENMDNENITCNFSFEELRYMLVMLTEGQDKINSSKTFEGFQDQKIQESILKKVRLKCWECHQNEL